MSTVRRAAGFTLIELMIAVAIVAILAAIALPSYRSSVIKANRRNAQAALMEIAQREQQYLLDQRSYAKNLAALQYTTPNDVSPNYAISIPAATCIDGPPPSCLIKATAIGAQATDGWLAIDNLGNKTSEKPNKW